MAFPDQDAATKRRTNLYAVHREITRAFFAPDGTLHNQESHANHYRALLPLAVPFLYGSVEERAFGNRILRAAPYLGGEFCSFTTLRILLRDRRYLEPETVSYLEGYLDRYLSKVVSPAHQFHGVNYNQSAMSTFEMLAGGEYIQDSRLIEQGVANLLQVRENFVRDGFSSEYTSPTYTPITLMAFEEIANLVRNENAVRIAKKAALRMWLEIAAFYHVQSRGLAAPMSRAYTTDAAGNFHMLHIVLYLLFGTAAAPSPEHYVYRDPSTNFVHNDYEFTCHTVSWQIAADYHPNEAVEELLFRKSYPYSVRGTVEFAECINAKPSITTDGEITFLPLSSINWPCRTGLNRSYMTEDYGMGTGTIQWMDGAQSEPFYITCRTGETVSSILDRTSIFARYLINTNSIAQPNTYPFFGKQTNKDDTRHEGSSFTLQKDNLVLYCTQPHRFERIGITCLRSVIVIPVKWGAAADEVWFGDRQVHAFDVSFRSEEKTVLRFGRSYVAFRPLTCGLVERETAVSFAVENGFGVISTYNYQGPRRDFEELEIVTALNGFLCQASSAAETEFGSFRKEALSGRVVDFFSYQTRKVRYLETGLQLHLEYSPSSLSYKQRTINGKREEEPQFACSLPGVSLRFPWLDEELTFDESYGDWAQLIADRGSG